VRVRLPRYVTRLVMRLVAPLVVDYSASRRLSSTTPPRAARHRQLRLAHTRRRLLRLRRASGCLGLSRGSLRRSSSTTSPTPRVRVPRHVVRPVTRLIVDYSVRRLQPRCES
jgi:hypothetical protein